MKPEPLTRSLGEHAFVRGMTAPDVEFLAGCTKNVRFAAGAFVFREGAPADLLLLLREGRVALESHAPASGVIQLETLGPGDALGWRALFEADRWHLDVRLEPTLAFAVDARCLKDKMEREPAFGFAVTRRLLYQAHRRLERARLQQLDVYRGPR